MNKSISEELLSKLMDLMSSGFKPIAEGSPVKRTEFLVFKGIGSFCIRQYEGYVGRSMDTGEAVNVPGTLLLEFKIDSKLSDALKNKEKTQSNKEASFSGSPLESRLMEIRDLVLAGQTSVELAGVGTFKVSSQEKPSGLKFFMNLEPTSKFMELLQTS